MEELGLKPKPKPTTSTTTDIDSVTANANPSGDNDYASGDSGTLTADNGTDGDDGSDDNNIDIRRNNKRGGSTLDKIKKSLSNKKRGIKTDRSKGGNLCASK